jgi:hypothetical protein
MVPRQRPVLHPVWSRLRAAGTLVLCLVAVAAPSRAGDPVPFSARSGLDVARDAARTWAPDARLVYVENDEDVAADGTAARWGYLFYSESRAKARGYSVRDGKILEAADLGFDFEAPPLADQWVDSQAALAAAEAKAGEKYRLEHNGRVSAMLLIRGAFDDKQPNTTTWALVYTSAAEPALFVVVDAARGEVIRTWRG